MRLVGSGDPSIRATHGKTIEFSIDAGITSRASCVVAVDSRVEDAEAPLVGPLSIELRAGDQAVTIHAEANPEWRPGGSVVIRRSPMRLPGTLATDADLGAAGLPPHFVQAARDASCEVTGEIRREERRQDGRIDLMLMWVDVGQPVDQRLAAELAAAEVVVAEDDSARDLAASAGRTAVTELADVPDGGRVLVLASADLPGASVRSLLGDPARCAIDVGNLPGFLAAASASPSGGPVVLAGAWARMREIREVLRHSDPASRLVMTVPAAQVPPALALAAELRGSAKAVVITANRRPVRVESPTQAEVPARGRAHCCFDGVMATRPVMRVPESDLAASVRLLAAEGVSMQVIARLVATLGRWPRRKAYEYALEVSKQRTGDHP